MSAYFEIRQALTQSVIDLSLTVPFAHVVLRFEQFGPLQGGNLHPRSRRFAPAPVTPFRILTVGHFQSAVNVGRGDPHLLGGVSPEFDVNRLPADDVAASGHDVGGRHPAGVRHLDAGIKRVQRIECSNDRLHRA